MANPTGGVKKLVCKTTAKRIVNQIGSKFRPATIGEINGSIISVSSIQSKKNPRIKVISKIVIRMPVGSKGSPRRVRSINSSPPKPRSTKEKAVAPSRTAKIYPVVRVVSLTTSDNTDSPILPFKVANIRAPAAPNPAASVGVAIPKKMLDSTDTIRAAGGSIALNKSHNEVQSKGTSDAAGARLGKTVLIATMRTIGPTTNRNDRIAKDNKNEY